jgi:MarR family transcriptional regulator, lower aerobic nicotinate degradation pathway regulator
MNELGRYLNLDKSSVSGLVGRAERRKLVRRRSNSDDGRSFHVVITATGRRLVDVISRELEEHVTLLVVDIPRADLRNLSRTAGRIVSNGSNDSRAAPNQ